MRTLLRSAPALALLAAAAHALTAPTPARLQGKERPAVFALQGVFDERTRQNAYTYLVPKGWTPRGEVSWGRDPGSFRVTVSASSPDKRYAATQMGGDVYTFNNIRSINGGTAMATNAPVRHATEYLRVLLDRVAQAEGATGVEVVDEANAPIPAEKVPAWLRNAPVPPWETRTPVNETGYLQVRFTRDGQAMTAMMGTTVRGFCSTTTLPGKRMGGSEGGFFEVGPTTFLTMPADAPASRQRELGVVAGSVRMTPTFRAYLSKLTDRLVQTRTGAAVAGRRYADATFHERAMAQFGERMRTRDAYSHAFCNYVSDLQDYRDPSGRTVTAPAGYRGAWSDGRGDYLFSDDPIVDLRGLGNGGWKPMAKARIGE